jgi:hypothetical protein
MDSYDERRAVSTRVKTHLCTAVGAAPGCDNSCESTQKLCVSAVACACRTGLNRLLAALLACCCCAGDAISSIMATPYRFGGCAAVAAQLQPVLFLKGSGSRAIAASSLTVDQLAMTQQIVTT